MGELPHQAGALPRMREGPSRLGGRTAAVNVRRLLPSQLDHENRIIAKRESIKTELLERAKKRIAINEKAAMQKAEKERRQIEERDSAMIEKLESEYKSHCDEWVDTIVARVVGE